MAMQMQARRPANAGPEARAVELWLAQRLACLHLMSLDSPLPSELISLAQRFDS